MFQQIWCTSYLSRYVDCIAENYRHTLNYAVSAHNLICSDLLHLCTSAYQQNEMLAPAFSSLCLADVKIPILEKLKKNYTMYRKEKEKYFLNKINTHYQLLNREN